MQLPYLSYDTCKLTCRLQQRKLRNCLMERDWIFSLTILELGRGIKDLTKFLQTCCVNNLKSMSSDHNLSPRLSSHFWKPARRRSLSTCTFGKGFENVNRSSSIAGSITYNDGRNPWLVPAYGSSKAALNFLTREWAKDLKPEGFTIIALYPGV